MPDRDAALEALRNLIERHNAEWSAEQEHPRSSSEPDVLLRDEARDIVAAAYAATDPRADPVAAHLLGWYHWTCYALSGSRSEPDLAAALPLFMLVYQVDPEAVPAGVRAAIAELLEQQGQPDDDEDWQTGETLDAPPGLREQGLALVDLFRRTGNPEALRHAIAAFRADLAARTEDDAAYAPALALLADALGRYTDRTGDEPSLAEALHLGREAVRLTPADHPDRGHVLLILGNALYVSYNRTSEHLVLAEAADIGRQAAAALGAHHALYPAVIENLVVALDKLAAPTQEIALLAEVVQLRRELVRAGSGDDRMRVSRLSDLGVSLQALYQQTGDASALEEAIRIGRTVVGAEADQDPDTPDAALDHSRHLSNLANALNSQFVRTGDSAVLHEALATARLAVAAYPEDGADRAPVLCNLANALRDTYRRTGETDVLQEALETERAAVAASAHGHPSHPQHVADLALTLRAVYERTGELTALHEAIDLARTAAAATGPAKGPRPASSTPATTKRPRARRADSSFVSGTRSELPHAIRQGHMRMALGAKKLGGENGAIVIHDDADARGVPLAAHVLLVAGRVFPRAEERVRGIPGIPGAGGDIFPHAAHVHGPLRIQRALLEAVVREVSRATAEFPAVEAHEFGMLLGHAVETGVAWQRRLPLRLAVGIHLGVERAGDRTVRLRDRAGGHQDRRGIEILPAGCQEHRRGRKCGKGGDIHV